MTGFEWGPRKNDRNRRKHGVTFSSASTVFEDPWALVAFDSEEDSEDRWILIGRATDRDTLVVAFAVREHHGADVIRIISARHALRHERTRYEQQAH
jgi:uncharacterized DUF497 family protein